MTASNPDSTAAALAEEDARKRRPATAMARFGFSASFTALYATLGFPSLALFQSVHAGLAGAGGALLRSFLDVVQCAVLVFATGGMSSPMSLGFALPVVFSSLGLNRQRGLLTAAAGTLAFLASELVVGQGLVNAVNIFGGASRPIPLSPVVLAGYACLVLIALTTLSLITNLIASKSITAREAAETAAAEIAGLNELSRLLNSSIDLDVIFNGIYDYFVLHTPVDTIWLMLVDREKQELYTYWGKRPDHPSKEEERFFADLRISLPTDGGTLAQTFAGKKPLVVADLSRVSGRTVINDLDGTPYRVSRSDVKIFATGRLQSLMQIPLILNNEVIAILNVAKHDAPLQLSSDEMRRTLALSEQITGALQNAILVDRARTESEAADRARAEAELSRQESDSARKETQALAELSRKVTQTEDVQTIMDEVQRFAAEHFQLEAAALFQVQRGQFALRYWSDTRHISVPAEVREAMQTLRIPLRPEGGTIYRTFKRGRPFYLPRISLRFVESRFDQALMRVLRFESFVQVPLRSAGSSIGVLAFTCRPERRLGPLDITLLQTMSDQVAGALRSAQQLEELEHARNETEALAELARRANESTNLDDIASAVHGVLQRGLGACSVTVYVVDEPTRTLHVRAVSLDGTPLAPGHYSKQVREVPLVPESGTLYRTFKRRRPFHSDRVDPRYLGNWPADEAAAKEFGFAWFVQVPLLVNGRVIGIFGIASAQPRRLSKEELQFVERVSAQVAGAVHAAELLRKAEEAQSEVTRMAEFARRLNERTDMQTLSEGVFAYLRDRFDLEQCALLLVDEERQDLWSPFAARAVHSPEFWGALRVPLVPESGSLFRTYEKQKPLYLPQIPNVELAAIDQAVLRANRLNAFVHVPLVVEERTVGIVVAAPNRRLTRADLAAVGRFCEQIAGAVRAARLLSEVQTQRDLAVNARRQVEILSEFTRHINEHADTDLSELLQLIFGFIRDNFGIEEGIVSLVDEERRRLVFQDAWTGDSWRPEQIRFYRELEVPLTREGGLLALTCRRRRTTYIPKVLPGAGTPLDQRIVQVLELNSLLQIPLLLRNEAIGVIWCTNKKGPLLLTREDILRLQAFADQIAGAVHTSQLLAQVRAAKERTELARAEAEAARNEIQKLNEISRQVNTTTNLDEILATVFDYLSDTYGFDGYLVMTPEKSHRGLELTVFRHVDKVRPSSVFEYSKTLRIPLDGTGGIVEKAFRRGKTVFRPDTTGDVFRIQYPGWELDRDMIKAFGHRSFELIPLLVHGESVAIILCAASDVLYLGKAARASIARFGEQVAGAVHTNRLLLQVGSERDRAERARQETETLAELSRRANEGHDVDGIVAAVMEVIARQFEADTLVLYSLDPDTQSLWLRSAFLGGSRRAPREFPDILREVPLVEKSGGLFRTFAKRRLLHMDRVSREWLAAHPVDAALKSLFEFQWFVDAPLLVDGEVIGLLAFTGRQARRLMRPEIQFVERIVAQVAGAVRAAELLRQTERMRSESDQLLARILPARVADELKREGHVEPLFYDAVSVLFTDFVGFTQASQKMRPDELVEELDGCFSQFDEVAQRNNMEKLKTIGDSYMCASGLPNLSPTHAVDACLTALEFRRFMAQMAEVKQALGHDFWQIRIGIHSGPVTAGVIGTHKFAYDIWGDTVNTASRMESSGKPGEVNISAATYELVGGFFECEHRGKVSAKGKGEMDMYYVLRIRPELSADEDGFLPNGQFEMMRMALQDPLATGLEQSSGL